MSIGVWLVMLLIAAAEAPSIIAKRQWRDLIAFGALWLLAGVYSSLVLGAELVDARIPNHTEILIGLLSALYRWLGIG